MTNPALAPRADVSSTDCHYMCHTLCIMTSGDAYVFSLSHASDGPDAAWRTSCMENTLGLSYVCSLDGVIVVPMVEVLGGGIACEE